MPSLAVPQYSLIRRSHLINDGVEESPPSRGFRNGAGLQELFINLNGANVGFTHWHPVAVTANGNKLAGQSDMGGLWEWTSSPLTKHDGFEPMRLYPAYTGMGPIDNIYPETDFEKPTSSTENTTSFSEALGQHILESLDARACKSALTVIMSQKANLNQHQLVPT